MGRDDLAGKARQMKEKIVDGRIGKRLQGAGLAGSTLSSRTVDHGWTATRQAGGPAKLRENHPGSAVTPDYTSGEGMRIEQSDFCSPKSAFNGRRHRLSTS